MPNLTSTEIRTEISALTDSLNKAREDAALFDRLKSAATTASSLWKRVDELTVHLAKAESNETEAAREAIFSQFDGIAVSSERDAGILGTNWTIAYKRLGFVSHLNASVMQEHVCRGFEALEGHAFRYLLEKHPQQIPEAIKALAPGDINAAFERYFVARQRGYLGAN